MNLFGIKHILSKLLLLSILLLCSQNFYSQSYYFDNYSVKDGLAQSTVYDVLQDSKGYVWLGTSAGVSRFDGLKFDNYTFEDGLGKNAVQKIIEDRNGNIWFGHKGGAISRLKGDSIQRFLFDTIKADITTMLEDREGNIWAGSFGMGAIKIKNPNIALLGKIDFIQYKSNKNEPGKLVFSIFETQDGTLYFIVNNEIKYYNSQEKIFKPYLPANLPKFYQFTCMFEDSQGNYWFGTDIGGLHQLKKDGTCQSYQAKDGLVSNFITCISEDKNNTIWIGTWGGGINTISNKFISKFTKENGLPDLKIRSITNDLEGNVLIGTNENGLCIFKGAGFINYSTKEGINGQQVNAILQDRQGNFWFGTDQGLSVFNKPEFNFKNPVYFNTENNKIPENIIRILREDKNGTVWVAGDKSVVSKNINSNEFDYNFLVNGYIRQNNLVTAMDVDKGNSLWVGTQDGLLVYDINKDVIARFNQQSGLTGNYITALFVDSRNRVWIGIQQKGLVVFDASDTLFVKIKDPANFTPICMTESANNKIWVGTQSQGIYVFDGLKLEKQFRSGNGLLSDYITGLYSAINDNIYIGTSRGLNKFNLKETRFSSYSGKSGFTGIEVKQNSGFVDKDGNVWLGTVKGATRINIIANQENFMEPLTHINRLRVNLKDTRLESGITLSYLENSIIFDYTSICLSDPEAVVYKTMLEGAQKDWQPETKQTTASFSGLSSGKYTFKLIARNNTGVWNKEPITFSFVIRPPFYQSFGFYIILAIIILGIIFFYIKMRERKLLLEKQILEEKVKERTQEISEKNKELEVYNRNVTGSIKYAKRIQDAMLPAEEFLKEILPEYFILYKPRDIVSGDYYWASKKGDQLVVAAVDCTGHGVPGAFMSMLGITLLDEIVNKKNVIKADDILNEMREAVIKSLKQKGMRGETQDGMDIALCSINTKTLEMQFSGAYNPIYIIRNDKLLRYRGNRMPIGIYYKKAMPFTNQKIQLQKNDLLYLFTDGYIDQFNEYSGEKLMTKNLKNYLLKSCHFPLELQCNYLDEKLKDWKGKIEQVDDVLIWGIKIDFSPNGS